MTLYEQKQAFTFVVSEDSDGAGYVSRDTFVAEGGANDVDFLVGEIFAVVDGKAAKLDLSATDCSEKFAGIAGYRARVPAGQAAPEMKAVGLVKSPGGRVDVILLGRGADSFVSDDVVARVNSILQADDGGQLTDIVTVRSVTPLLCDIVVDAIIPAGPSPAPIRVASEATLAAATTPLQTIGGVAPSDALITAGRTSTISAAINPIASRSRACRTTGSWRCAARSIAPSPRTSARSLSLRAEASPSTRPDPTQSSSFP